MAEVFAVAFALVTGLVVAFQVALALGAHGAPTRWAAPSPDACRRCCVAALIQALVLAALALIVLADAGLLDVPLLPDWPWLVWVPVAVSAVAVVLNASTRSRGERRIWLPVTIVLLLSSLGVALA